jgi:hypothetical protein
VSGPDPSLAWFGWEAVDPSTGEPYACPDDVGEDALADRGVWAATNPALGSRIAVEHMEKEHRAMPARSFAVELLNVGDWPDPDPDAGRRISGDAWAACANPRSEAAGAVCFSFDVPPGRGSCAVAAAGWRRDGAAHVEVVDMRAGTAWVADRLVELVGRHATVGVTVAKASPAASLIPKVETALEASDLPANPKTGARLRVLETQDQAKACGELFDLVEQLALRHLGQTELAAAVRGAATRPLGDAWLWSRTASAANVSPLIACTNALWGLATIEPPAPPVDVSRMRLRRL